MVFQSGDSVHFVSIANSVPYTISSIYAVMFPNFLVASNFYIAKYQMDQAGITYGIKLLKNFDKMYASIQFNMLQ